MLPLDFSGYLQTAALGFICHFKFPFRHNVAAEREEVIWFEIQGEVAPQFRVKRAHKYFICICIYLNLKCNHHCPKSKMFAAFLRSCP